jgi:hypothetical protein
MIVQQQYFNAARAVDYLGDVSLNRLDDVHCAVWRSTPLRSLTKACPDFEHDHTKKIRFSKLHAQ